MSTRRSQGKARTELPRSSELAAVDPEAIPDGKPQARDASGRFAGPNPDASQARMRALIADGLGRDLQGGAGELGRKAHRMYRAFMRDLPCDCMSVRSLVGQRARAATLADFYATLGAKAGPHTKQGAAWLGEAQKWDARAERLAVTSLDVSTRLAAAARKRPIDVHAEVARVFGAPGDEV